MEIKGIPDTVTREQVTELVRALGMDPGRLSSLTITPWDVQAEVWHTDPETGAATPHRDTVHIKVTGAPKWGPAKGWEPDQR